MEDPITVQCPWCGESFVSFYDPSSGNDMLIEDCQVCCRPIELRVRRLRNGTLVARGERS